MGCCLSSSAAPDAVDEEAPATKKQARRVQKERLHSGLSSDDHAFDESFKGKTKRGRQLVRRFSGSGDAEGEEAAERPGACDLHDTISAAAQQQPLDDDAADEATTADSAAAAAVAAAEAEAAAAAEAAEAARAAAEAAEAAAKAKAEAEAAEHAAKLNSALASRIASKPRSRAQALHTSAALELTEGAGFERFVKWEDEVQKAASALLGSRKVSKRAPKKGSAAQNEASLFTLLAMEEQTRNSSFVAALQTRDLSKALQGKALRAYGMLCDNILMKLTRRLPTMAAHTAPLVSAYLSALSQHRDLSKAARPDGFVS